MSDDETASDVTTDVDETTEADDPTDDRGEPRGPDFDVEEVLARAGDGAEGVTLQDDELHRPDELDGETVACTLTGTEAEKRAAWIRSELVPHLEAVERRSAGSGSGDGTEGAENLDGYTLVFAEEALEAVMRFVRHEHWCCSFAHFEVHVTPGEEPNELTVYGPEGTGELFESEFVERMAEAAGVPGLA